MFQDVSRGGKMTLQKIICKVILPKCADVTKTNVKIGMKEKRSSIFVIKLLFFVAFTSHESTHQTPSVSGVCVWCV